MSTTDIMTAAFDHLESFSYYPPPDILWPGLNQEPPDAEDAMWLQPGFFPNEETDFAWENDACVASRGFFQILVYFRPGVGLVKPSTLADALIAHFAKGTALGGVRVRKRPHQSPHVVEDASKLYIPVTVPYLGLT